MPGLNDKDADRLAVACRLRSKLQSATTVLAIYITAHFALALIEAAAR